MPRPATMAIKLAVSGQTWHWTLPVSRPAPTAMASYLQLLLAACVFVTSTVTQQTCPDSWKDLGEYCYSFEPAELDQYDSWDECESWGAELATIDSKEENDDLKSWLVEVVPDRIRGVWIAPESYDYKWTKGGARDPRLEFSDWAADEPVDKPYSSAYLSREQGFSWAAQRHYEDDGMGFLCKKAKAKSDLECIQG